MEHIQSINDMLQNAKDQELSQKCIWLELLRDMLSQAKIPTEIFSYINDMYSKLIMYFDLKMKSLSGHQQNP